MAKQVDRDFVIRVFEFAKKRVEWQFTKTDAFPSQIFAAETARDKLQSFIDDMRDGAQLSPVKKPPTHEATNEQRD